ncbi:MAG: DUF4363 family protein [Clostridia bacterium]|nr:DUF4363 family protein [Clostridia bacterium]
MKRLWAAVALFLLVIGLCTGTQMYLRRQTTVLLSYLDELEASYLNKKRNEAVAWAHRIAEEYEQRTAPMDCFVAHSDLEDSRETAVMLPAIVEQDGREELLMEVARLREQLEHLRQIDRPTWRNVL